MGQFWFRRGRRPDLAQVANEISGPAVIEQLDTTTVIHPEQQATVDDYRNLIVREKA